MSRASAGGVAARPADAEGQLLGIGAAAASVGVSERALRYYQQLGLITPSGCTPGGMRRYSQDDLARVARIRQLQTLLGLNLDEIALVLRNEDRMAQIRRAYHHERTSDAERQELARESLALQLDLRATVEAKRQAIQGFLADLDGRIGRIRDVLGQMEAETASARPGRRDGPGRATRAGGKEQPGRPAQGSRPGQASQGSQPGQASQGSQPGQAAGG